MPHLKSSQVLLVLPFLLFNCFILQSRSWSINSHHRLNVVIIDSQAKRQKQQQTQSPLINFSLRTGTKETIFRRHSSLSSLHHVHNDHGSADDDNGDSRNSFNKKDSFCISSREKTRSRRQVFKHSFQSALAVIATTSIKPFIHPSFAKEVQNGKGELFEINDPDTYSALVYVPSAARKQQQNNENNKNDNPPNAIKKQYPTILLLHGAGKNTEPIWNLANPNGEHAGLIPSLLNSSPSETSSIVKGSAPSDLFENFIVIAPYSYKKQSFYEEPRSKILQFVKWACSSTSTSSNSNPGNDETIIGDLIDKKRLFLFGFSDGATLGVELMTTNYFAGGIFASYGFTGTLPSLALERLKGKPMWIFHSKDDVIFPVECSDRLVRALRAVNGEELNGKYSSDGGNDGQRILIRYTRFERDQEGFTGSVRGHSTGISASKDKEVYQWLLNL